MIQCIEGNICCYCHCILANGDVLCGFYNKAVTMKDDTFCTHFDDREVED